MLTKPYPRKIIKSVQALFLTALTLVLFSTVWVQARAGGGEGYSSGGGSNSDSYGSGMGSGMGSGFGSGMGNGLGGRGGSVSFSDIMVLIFIAILFFYLKSKFSQVKQVQGFKQTLDPDLQAGIRKSAPAGSTEALELQKRLNVIFVSIQSAWDQEKMERVRADISDGVYNRFQIQLDMNHLQGKHNKVENPTLLSSKIIGESVFGRYKSIDFLIRGRVVDTDLRIDTGEVIRGGGAMVFEEIWSFTRLAEVPSHRGEQAQGNCPQCAAPLQDAGGSRCSHCGAVLNSGAFDWVLSEITQAEEWVTGNRNNLQSYYARFPEIAGEDSKLWLSPQEMEDRASVVFIRYQSALHQSRHNAGSLRGLTIFTTPDLLQTLSGEKREEPLFHLAVGAVDLLGFTQSQDLIKAYIQVKYSGSHDPNQAGSLKERIMVFSKAKDAATGKSNMSSMTCPNCAGPIESSDQAKCAYCDNVLTNPAANWVLAHLGSRDLLAELNSSPSLNGPPSMAYTAKSAANAQMQILSSILFAALEDEVISPEEEETIRDFARHFGHGPLIVEIVLKKARENPSALSEPLEKPLALKWLNNLMTVAMADGKITAAEEDLLLSFARRYGIEDKQVRFGLKAAGKV